MQNWLDSITKYVKGLIRVRDMLMQDLITAVDFPMTFIVELLDVWYARYISPWVAYYHEASREWLREVCKDQWCDRVYEDYYYEDFAPVYVKLPAAVTMMCINVVIVTMGIFIPWQFMIPAFILSPWLSTRMIAETLPIVYRAMIVKRFRLFILLLLCA